MMRRISMRAGMNAFAAMLFLAVAFVVWPLRAASAGSKHQSKAKNHASASHRAAAHHSTRAHSSKTSRKSASSKAGLRNAKYSTPTHHRRRRRRRVRRHRVVLPKAPSAERTVQIQMALERRGYYSGEPSRKWDSTTAAALRKFQAANDLPPTGKLDALSLQRLGLGSDIAGVSPPRPVAPQNPSTQNPGTPKTPSAR